jgi:hypothetical protein
MPLLWLEMSHFKPIGGAMPKRSLPLVVLCLVFLVITVTAQPVIQRNPTTRFAVIGDYGDNSSREAEVAALVHRLAPDFVITTGDNNYPAGEASTIDQNIGQYYSSFIGQYQGAYGEGSLVENRFFPSLGNHDWQTGSVQPYTDYFTLPGNERYYEFSWGSVRLFAIDTDPHEPDGYIKRSIQSTWLRQRLAATTEPWRVVYMHHPPYTSVEDYDVQSAKWPFAEWGASLVLAGHAHSYERLEAEGMTYIINGLGGANPNSFGRPIEGSQFRFNAAHGAMLVEVTETSMTTNLYGIYGHPVASMDSGFNAGEWIEFDLTPSVQSDGLYTFVVDATINQPLAFNATESGTNQPELLITTANSTEPLRLVPTEDATLDGIEPFFALGNENSLRLIRTKNEYLRVYLQFQVSGITEPIESVRLRLYAQSVEEAHGGIAVYLADSSIAWTDETLLWDNAPAIIVDDRPIDSFTMQR